MTVIPYPPSSPDVALCHFFLFQKLKMGLKGAKFNDDDDDMIQAESQDGLGQISSSTLHRILQAVV
jgi:hypothetical protein